PPSCRRARRAPMADAIWDDFRGASASGDATPPTLRSPSWRVGGKVGMGKKFYEGIEALKKVIGRNTKGGGAGKNEYKGVWMKRGGVLTYWPGTGTVSVQGQWPDKEKLEASLDDGEGATFEPATRPANAPRKKVFVVYGHDTTARTQLDAMLRRWGLDPVILDDLPSKGQTIIEKLEDYTEDVGFGVVLATPDDLGYPKDHEDKKRIGPDRTWCSNWECCL